jgi:hypothetical protein
VHIGSIALTHLRNGFGETPLADKYVGIFGKEAKLVAP